MYISEKFKEVETGVYQRIELISDSNAPYLATDFMIENQKKFLRSDKLHYDRLLEIVKEQMPALIGKYKNVCSVAGGFPKFEEVILQPETITIIDQSAEMYTMLFDEFKLVFNPKAKEIKYIDKIFEKPINVNNDKYDCTCFIHFLEHCNSSLDLFDWIKKQTTDIVIYMPCIESAKGENWWHYDKSHNVFPTLKSLLDFGESIGYKCNGFRYSDDMLIWMEL